jgi:serine/threonine-protein kinase PknK
VTRRFTDFLARLRKGPKDPERERLAGLLELNRALAAAHDRKQLLTLLLDHAIGLFGAERGFLVRAEDGAPGFTVEVARSLDREPVRNPLQKISSTIVGRCLAERIGVYSADAQEGDFAASKSVADIRLRSVLCMPLVAGERLLGCLYLDHRFQSGAFSQDDLTWLQGFADQAAIALHLHQLVDENRSFAERLAHRNAELEAAIAAQAVELTTLRETATRETLRHPYPEILGTSPALMRCLHLLDRVVDADFPVLLVGESGTGKELFAQALHRYGRRAAAPFVAVNAAAITGTLLESELFGHRRGAFTGADRDRPGLLRQANGGTLFLDEVTEMDLELQAKLLRFLEDGIVRPVGGDRGERVDLRIVAASNRVPAEAVEAGRMRHDLYYRLAVVVVELPPLRERRDDIPLLADHFLGQAAHARGGESRTLTDACRTALQRRDWPGNLRELRNEILRLDALSTGSTIGPEQLTPEPKLAGTGTLDLGRLEAAAIQEALRVAGGNKAEAARLLGISRRTLYSKLSEREPETPA